jgi:hypothetical protein
MQNNVGIWKVFTHKGNTSLKCVLVVYVLAFIGAFYNHASDLIQYGLFPYQRMDNNVKLWLNVFWTLLTILDPLAIVILFFSIKDGIYVFLVIIVVDVIINYSFIIQNYGLWSWINYGQICQLLFMLFVLVTFMWIRKKVKEIEERGT